MNAYRTVARHGFAIVFILGGLVHLVLGRVAPAVYGAFGGTALLPQLEALWTSFVMPNIWWLTIAVGFFELLCGIGMTQKRFVRLSALGMIGFLLFVTVLGYGFPTTSIVGDILANRITTVVMAALLVPLLVTSEATESEEDEVRRS